MTIDFNGCFDRFRDTAFRMETMQRYTVDEDEPATAARRSGRARPEFSVRTSAWAARLAATTIAGKSWRRVRAVDLPLSEYVRWEMAAYGESSVLGEQIRILTRTSKGPDEDFWLFDAAGTDPCPPRRGRSGRSGVRNFVGCGHWPVSPRGPSPHAPG